MTGVQYKKGPYSASEGDFSAAGSANINYVNVLAHAIATVSTGQDGWATHAPGGFTEDWRWHAARRARTQRQQRGPCGAPGRLSQDQRGPARYSRGNTQNAFSLTGLAYTSTWNSTDQVPDRAIAEGRIPRFGNIDPTDGGRTARYSFVGDYQHTSSDAWTRATVFVSKYRLNLFSNFTYFLDDPVHGDQFEQADRRWIAGGRITQTRKMRWGSRLGETTFGLQLRNDDIPLVGLYHTEAQVRLSTTREDAVTETSAWVSSRGERTAMDSPGCGPPPACASTAFGLTSGRAIRRILASGPAASSVPKAA